MEAERSKQCSSEVYIVLNSELLFQSRPRRVADRVPGLCRVPDASAAAHSSPGDL